MTTAHRRASGSHTRAPRRRGLALAAVATLSALLLTGCNGDDSSQAAGTTSASSQSQSAGESPSSSTSSSARSGAGPVDASALLPAIKQAVQPGQTVHMAMSVSGGAATDVTGQGDIRYSKNGPTMAMTMTVPGGNGQQQVSMRVIHGIFYLSLPPMTPPGKFVKIDSHDPNSPLGDLSTLTDQMNPLSSFQTWQHGLKKARLVGEDDIDGEQTRHYVLTVDTKQALKQLGGKVSSSAQLPDHLTYDLWLGEDDLMRRVSFDLMGMSTRIDMTKWGEPVHVETPSRSDVVKMPGLG